LSELETLGQFLKITGDRPGKPHLRRHPVDRVDGVAEGRAGRQVE